MFAQRLVRSGWRGKGEGGGGASGGGDGVVVVGLVVEVVVGGGGCSICKFLFAFQQLCYPENLRSVNLLR
jgi:hypothetical protein